MDSTSVFEATRIPQVKQNKGFGLQNKPEQTYDRDFAQSFRDEAPRAQCIADATNDKQDVPESA